MKTKKFTSLLILTLLVLFTFPTSVFANNTPDIPKDVPNNFGRPIKETQYYDSELEATVIQRSYCVPNTKVNRLRSTRSTSGEGWYRNEKTFKWANNSTPTTVYVEGYFAWNGKTVTVTNTKNGHSALKLPILEDSVTTGTGRNIFLQNYAYAKYNFKVKALLGNTRDLSVSIEVKANGSVN